MIRILRRHVTAIVLGLLLLPSVAAGASGYRDVEFERSVAVQVNAFRVAHGLTTLHSSPGLKAAAETHSLELADNGYFGHESPNGGSFWQRVKRFYPVGQADFWSVGENLYWSSEEHPASFVLERWFASPEHRRILERERWREMGVSAIWVHGAPGVYGGRDVAIVTVDFGVRR